MDRIKLIKLGTPIDIEIQSVVLEKCRCSLLGVGEGRFLLLSFPSAERYPNAAGLIKSDIPIVVRLLLEGDVAEIIAFKSEIISILSFPAKLFFIRYPAELQSHNLRKEARAKINIAATLYADGGEESVTGRINDLSSTGCCFIFSVHAESAKIKKEQVTMTLSLPDGQHAVLRGRVRNQRNQRNQNDAGRSISLGIELEHFEESLRIMEAFKLPI